jgi:hypothetical protein
MHDTTIGVLVVVIIFALYYYNRTESFATKADKSEAVSGWFEANKEDPKYANYKKDLGSEANIVDYETARMGGQV